MKAKDIRELTDDELRAKLDEGRKERLNLRLQQSTAQLEKPSRIRELRRDAARIRTIMNERKRGVK